MYDRAEPCLALAQCCLRANTSGHLLHHHVDASHRAGAVEQWIPLLEEVTHDTRLIDRLAGRRYVDERLPGFEHLTRERLDVLRDDRKNLMDGASDVLGHRPSVDRREPLVDPTESQLTIEHPKTNGCVAIDGLELGQTGIRRLSGPAT